VAAVASGGALIDVFLGTADWSTYDVSADTQHYSTWATQPFVTFAGPWAEARWTLEHEPDVDDLDEALDYAWDDNGDGDTAKYESRVDVLDEVAAVQGFSPVGRAWEHDWGEQLEAVWPVICRVAAMLIDGQHVSHDVVQSLLGTS
jgi:thymidylate synthase